MRKLFSILIAVLLTATVSAQAPAKMSYQAVIRNSNDQLVINTQVGMKISIQKFVIGIPPTYQTVYIETHTQKTNDNGLVSIQIGGGTVIGGNFATIDWSAGEYYIKTETDPTGGTNYTISGTSQLLSVPYALYAKTGGGGFTHYIGELYGGGIVVSVWKESGVEHGLIASLTDISPSTHWSSITSKLIGATAQSPIDGQANTTAIIGQGDVGGAAYLCNSYSSGGFSDWYLPSAFELNQCFNAAFIVNTILGATNGFKFTFYFSSTESDASFVWGQNFSNGATNNIHKQGAWKVRGVRRF